MLVKVRIWYFPIYFSISLHIERNLLATNDKPARLISRISLVQYDYSSESVRVTEQTNEKAPVELPHVKMTCDAHLFPGVYTFARVNTPL